MCGFVSADLQVSEEKVAFSYDMEVENVPYCKPEEFGSFLALPLKQARWSWTISSSSLCL